MSTMPILTLLGRGRPRPARAPARSRAPPRSAAFMPSSREMCCGGSEALATDGELERHATPRPRACRAGSRGTPAAGRTARTTARRRRYRSRHSSTSRMLCVSSKALPMSRNTMPIRPSALGDREAVLEGDRGELVAADHVGLVEVVEVVDVLVVEAVALAVPVALEARGQIAVGAFRPWPRPTPTGVNSVPLPLASRPGSAPGARRGAGRPSAPRSRAAGSCRGRPGSSARRAAARGRRRSCSSGCISSVGPRLNAARSPSKPGRSQSETLLNGTV